MRKFWESRPGKKERKIVETALQSADPTTFSHLPVAGPVMPGRDFYEKHPEDGDQFVDLSSAEHKRRTADAEMIVARLLKGIINVSDVVPGRGLNAHRRYSKVMPLERIQTETRANELEADVQLLAWLFGDSDHSKGHNVLATDTKAAYFDFGSAYLKFFKSPPDKMVDFLGAREVLSLAVPKAKALRDRISGAPGERFIREIAKNISLRTAFQYPSSDTDLESKDLVLVLQENLLKRIDHFLKNAEAVLSEQAA